MQAKTSAGNDCLRFPKVTCGNSPAPVGNLHEAFIVRVRADFLKPRDASFYPVPNTLTEVTLLLLKSMVNPSNLILFQKSWTGQSLLALQSVIQKIHLNEKFFTITKLIGNRLLSLLTSFTILEWKNNVEQK